MTPKRLTYVLSALIALIVIAGGVGYWLGHQSLTQKSTEVSQVLADISLVNEELDSYRQLEQQYASMEPLEDDVYEVLPTEKQQAEVTLQLHSLVNSTGLELNGLNFESTSGRPGTQSQTVSSDVPGVLVMPVSFQIDSSYDNFVELLRKIENHQRYMQISNLSISRTEENLQFNISLEVFLQP